MSNFELERAICTNWSFLAQDSEYYALRCEKQMARERRKKIQGKRSDRPVTACVGAVLLNLRNALLRAERCRHELTARGYSKQRWQEIVKDVDPELRFMVRSNTLDRILSYLRSKSKPLDQESLVRDLSMQGVAERRIRQSITANLRNRRLLQYPGGKIGLPEWQRRG